MICPTNTARTAVWKPASQSSFQYDHQSWNAAVQLRKHAMENFRRIDVDKYDEDVLLEDELIDVDPRSPSELAGVAQQKSSEVRSLIGKGDARGALAVLLVDPPYGDANANAKSTTLASLFEIFNVTKSSEISAIVKSLSSEEQDTLMKFIYKGLASPELGASALLLGWHEKLTEAAGTGCIVRVLTDRRRF